MSRKLPIILIRFIVGLVFLTEGILKFTQPGELGVGRFAHIGIPFPHILSPIVAVVEIAAGTAVMVGFYAGDAAILLLCVIVTALITTKLPILLGHPLGKFAPPRLNHYGVLSFLHESRTDLCVLFGCIAIWIDSGLRLIKKPW